VQYERINYLMLMMVDPHVHYHVIPRYSTSRTFNGVEFVDAGWPALPQLGGGVATDDALRDALVVHFRANWRLQG
jgi:diadenosine tetraphosphate (Ap4A) HIT family hydrolase